jgi:hypothetical protein
VYRSYIFALLAVGIGLAGVTQAASRQTCRPALAFRDVRFSQMQPPTMERKWTAVLSVDATHCTTTSGRFEIVFSRLKEIGPDLEFRQQFMWNAALVEVSVDFSADEAVAAYRLDNILPCPCRD